ncbi:MAG TPA: MBL fold metallo-hydrolase, partial [Terriglobales bacterium]|nr:MBL fold metallo-hydrolase [Terriglobales bacterium]
MRRILLALIFAAAGLLAQTGAKSYFTLHEVGRGVFAAIATPGSSAGSNAGFVIGDDGVLVVDTFEDPAAAQALLAAIRERTGLPVRYVVNTHYHLDHVAGNQVFADAGAMLCAQRNVRAWIHTDNLKFFGAHPTPAQQARVAAYRAPELLYDDGLDIWLGTRHIVVRVLPGHTGGDSAVLVPDADVVFTGDLFWDHSLPNLVDASTAQLLPTLTRLQAWPPHPDAATFVPGHGELGKRTDMVAFRGYLVALRATVAAGRAHGLSGESLAAAALSGLQAKYGTWGFF